MRRTLLVTMDFYPAVGGVSNYWLALSERIDPSRWVVLAPPLQKSVSEHKSSIRIIRRRFFSSLLFPRWLPLVFSLFSVVRKERIELIIVGQTLPVGTAVRIVSLLTSIPYIVSTHGMDITLSLSHPRKKLLSSWILSGAEKVITISAYTARVLGRYGISGKKICFVQPCPRITPASLAPTSAHAAPTRSPIILTVARLVRRKGHDTVISALPEIIKKFPSCLYAIIGEGGERGRLEERVRELRLEEHVLFLGLLSDEHTAWWYQHAGVFVMVPTDEGGDVEGFGLVYLEAGSFGKPVIASDTGGVPDAVLDGVTGIVIPQESPERCARALKKILADPVLAHRMGSAARSRIEREFSWDLQAKKLKHCIDD
ncbi:MAG: glycosyltransferase family 4 protein [Patescibacteria group bacterium]